MSHRMLRVCALMILILAFTVLSAGAQNVTMVKADISVTESSTECRVEYALKNGGQELKEFPISSILFQDTGITGLRVNDSSGKLNVTGAAADGKYTAMVAPAKAIPAGGEYSFTVAYSVQDSVKAKGDTSVLTVPLLHLPFKSVIGTEPAFQVQAKLPEGSGLIRTSPRIISTDTSNARPVVTTSSAVLVSFFHAEYTDGSPGFFTPETTAIILFFLAIVVMIVLWWYYNFVYLKKKSEGGK